MFSSYDTLDNDDLTLLRRVLEDVCADKGLQLDGDEAKTIARELVNWYLFGVKHPDQLKEMLRPLTPTGCAEVERADPV
ncbi:hypothetical protein [Neorhizobium alkalisoli]|uniref:hypothetical protein n=1 Tax=Neorhizobium alkalisoli TaxID=528178 RepID=UPI000CF93683|nr:hypothetical protein [Neorhizobium alkalisoli]